MTEYDLSFAVPQLHFNRRKKINQSIADAIRGVTKVVVKNKYFVSGFFFVTDSSYKY